MTLDGKLEKRFLAGPVWVLATADADYELRGEISDELDGKLVLVEGERAKASFSMNMVGEVIEVATIKVAP